MNPFIVNDFNVKLMFDSKHYSFSAPIISDSSIITQTNERRTEDSGLPWQARIRACVSYSSNQ